MENNRINWQTALVGICTVVLTLLGTGTQIHPLEGNQRDIVAQLLDLSTANKELNKAILQSVSESHALNERMLQVVENRTIMFGEINKRLDMIEKRIAK